MSFFQTSDGKDVQADGKFDNGGGDLPPIPKGTQVLAMIDQARWTTNERDGTFIDLRWTVAQPSEYSNRKVFQKVKVKDQAPATRDKAIRMLAAIDTNAGGKLMSDGAEPTDNSLMAALSNRPMVLKLEVWELDDKSASGNWVSQVAPRKGGSASTAQAPQQAVPAPTPSPAAAPEDDDPFGSIPF